MKVLHFSDSGLPDTRVERYGFIQKELGYERIFVGQSIKGFNIEDAFSEKQSLIASRQAFLGLPFYYSDYKKRFLKLYNQIKPDLVHCHNYLPAKVCYDLKIRYIYDDHEFWKEYVRDVKRRLNYDYSLKKKITTGRLASFVSKVEKKIAENAFAVISVSSPIVDYYKTLNKNSYLIINYPSSHEIKLQENNIKTFDKINSILVSNYNSINAKLSTDKLIDLYSKFNQNLLVIGNVPKKFDNIEYLGYLSHNDYIKKLYSAHLGLIALNENRIDSFYYYGPNRYFQYAHSGVIPVFHKNMRFMIDLFKENQFTINKEEDIKELFEIIQNDREQIISKSQNLLKYARENFIFDKQKDLIKKIYEDYINDQ